MFHQLTFITPLQAGEENHLLEKRQVATTEMMEEEGSGKPVELLVEQPKTGASLGQILGRFFL